MDKVVDMQKKRQERFERKLEKLIQTVENPVQRKAIESLLRTYKLLGEALGK